MYSSNFKQFLVAMVRFILNAIFTDASHAQMQTNCKNVIIDKVWSGAPVGPTAISTRDAIFAAYYNSSRNITVAKINLANCQITRKQLGSKFGGYDTHNYIAMAFDKDNILHVSGNQHVVPLVYYKAKKPFDIETLDTSTMTGVQENQVTYPVFFFKDSELYFMYRNGKSGDGAIFINKYLGKMKSGEIAGWIKLNKDSIFSNIATVNGKSISVSAYPSTITSGPDGKFHFAIDWRQNSDVSSNYSVTYVNTRDFINWFDVVGNSVQLPISPDKVRPAVTEPGVDAGLVNSVKMSFTASGQPVVLFTQYVETPNGVRNGIFASKFANGNWSRILLATSSDKAEIRGTGSLSNLPAFSALTLYGPVARMTYRFFGEPAGTLNLDSETLAPTDRAPEIPAVQTVKVSQVSLLPGLEADANIAVRTVGYQNLGGPLISIRWRSLPSNNDQAFVCPPSAKLYRTPPASNLVLDTAWPK